MGKPKRKFVAKASSCGVWRIWNKTAKKFWGECYNRRPDELIDELNGERRPEIISELSRKLQIESKSK